jgi:hypothetical protein
MCDLGHLFMCDRLYSPESLFRYREILRKILTEFVKEPSPSKLVHRTKTGCQNMVYGGEKCS